MPSELRKCEICRQWIDPERVRKFPKSNLCNKHAEEIKKYGGEYMTIGEQERTSKKDSIKINLGGISTKMVPNTEGIEKLRRDYEDQQS